MSDFAINTREDIIMKICSKCKQEKDKKEFYKRKIAKDGLSSWCKTCQNSCSDKWKVSNSDKYIKYHNEYRKANPEIYKKSALKHSYNLSIEDYNRMFKVQKGKCAICGGTIKLCVDHDHRANKVRGLLCYGCNMYLGYIKDNCKILSSAIKYIKSNR